MNCLAGNCPNGAGSIVGSGCLPVRLVQPPDFPAFDSARALSNPRKVVRLTAGSSDTD